MAGRQRLGRDLKSCSSFAARHRAEGRADTGERRKVRRQSQSVASRLHPKGHFCTNFQVNHSVEERWTRQSA
eukprot:scaffold636_cov252-Pinguiococcus_pyrenoidosus.AAC.15